MTKTNWGLSPVPFLPGLELSRRFYTQAVKPVLAQRFPGLRYTAGLVGYGSDVLGFDTPMSRDHMWGPRLVLFLPEAELSERLESIREALSQALPVAFLGYPTHFEASPHDGVLVMSEVKQGPVEPLIDFKTIPGFIQDELGWNPAQPLEPTDWLTFPQQRLLGVTAGNVFHDDLGLKAVRKRLAYYPRDVWLYLLACQWMRIAQEEPFVGRTGDLGDELGSRLITARLVHDLMLLAFLIERRYAPYSKWFGSAFRRLEAAASLNPMLEAALRADAWQPRQAALAQAYEWMAYRQNALGLVPRLDPHTVEFYGRPFRVLFAERFARALQGQIEDAQLHRLSLIGGVNQISDATDFLESRQACRHLKGLYEQEW
jgi:hypothetical protein